MKWVKRPEKQTSVVDPELVKTRPKPLRKVVDPSAVKRRPRPEKHLVVDPSEVRRRKQGFQEDSIPAGTLCRLRKQARVRYGFDFCTVLKTHPSTYGTLWADVLSPDGNLVTMDAMWLRNDTVENGNTEEDEESVNPPEPMVQ